jgi:hypothetical protein
MRGYPDRLIDPVDALNEVRPMFMQAKINECDDQTEEPKKISCRNKILSAGMIGIDINFSEFERKLFREKREGSFLTTITTLGLTTAGAMTGTAVLSGIATGVVGSKDAFDKEILLDQAANAIHTQMRALRQTVANRIRFGMKQSTDDYPLDAALIDIEEYYNAGTLLGAFVGITSSAGLQVKESEVNKDRVAQGKDILDFSSLTDGGKPVSYDGTGQSTTKEAMKKWIANDVDSAKRTVLKKWIKDNEIKDAKGRDVTPSIFMQADNFEQERDSFLKSHNNR